MISKITSSNSELFYKPAFDLINNAIVEQRAKRSDANAAYYFNNVPEIKTIEDYFKNITAIRELWVNLNQSSENIISGDIGGYLLLMPADEDIFVIDANTREIAVPAKVKKSGIGVYGDHFAEMIVLQIDRYFDNQDLLKTKCAINWNFTAAGDRQPKYGIVDDDGVFIPQAQAEEAFVPNADINPNKVTFGFIINKNMTPEKGTLTFSVTFYDEAAGNISYSFNTLTASVNINDTLTLKDPALVKTDVSNFLGRLTNSVYSDSTMMPISNPMWRSGDLDANDNPMGLPNVEYLPVKCDAENIYQVKDNYCTYLRAFAVVDPATADIYYRWVYTPADADIDENEDNDIIKSSSSNTVTRTLINDYINVTYDQMDELGNYWLLDTNNRPLQSVTINSNVYPLPMQKRVLDNLLAENPPAITVEEINSLSFKAVGTSYPALKAGTYHVFAQGHSGTGDYVEVPEGTELTVGVRYYTTTLIDNEEKIDTLNPIMNAEAKEAQAEGKTLYVFQGGISNSAEVQSNVCTIPGAIKPVVDLKVEASSVFNFENNPDVRKLDGADELGYTYLIENADSVITFNADVNLPNSTALDKAGQMAVQLVGENPVAIKSVSDLESISRSLHFVPYPIDHEIEENEKLIGRFSSTPIPFVEMDMSMSDEDLDNVLEILGIELENEEPTRSEKIDAVVEKYGITFDVVVDDATKIEAINAANKEPKFFVDPSLAPGGYVVRVFNRRNGTYSVSEPSNTIRLSYVAPAINKISVTALLGNNNNIAVLTDGHWVDKTENDDGHMVNLELNASRTSITFEMVDTTHNYDNAAATYYVEEVDLTAQGQIQPRDITAEGYEVDVEDDLRQINNIEVVMEEAPNTGIAGYKGTFTITGDPGYYRIKTVNVYNGTEHTFYSDIFGVTSH